MACRRIDLRHRKRRIVSVNRRNRCHHLHRDRLCASARFRPASATALIHVRVREDRQLNHVAVAGERLGQRLGRQKHLRLVSAADVLCLSSPSSRNPRLAEYAPSPRPFPFCSRASFKLLLQPRNLRRRRRRIILAAAGLISARHKQIVQHQHPRLLNRRRQPSL